MQFQSDVTYLDLGWVPHFTEVLDVSMQPLVVLESDLAQIQVIEMAQFPNSSSGNEHLIVTIRSFKHDGRLHRL